MWAIVLAATVALVSCGQVSGFVSPRNPVNVTDALLLFETSSLKGEVLQAQRAMYWIQKNFAQVLRSPQLPQLRSETIMQVLSQPMSVAEIEVFRAVRRIIQAMASRRQALPSVAMLLSTVRFAQIDFHLFRTEVVTSGIVPINVLFQVLLEVQSATGGVPADFKRQVSMACPPQPRPQPLPTTATSVTRTTTTTASWTPTPTEGTNTTSASSKETVTTVATEKPTTQTLTTTPSSSSSTNSTTTEAPTTVQPIYPPRLENILTHKNGAYVQQGNFTLAPSCTENPLIESATSARKNCYVTSKNGDYVTIVLPRPYVIKGIDIATPFDQNQRCSYVIFETSSDAGDVKSFRHAEKIVLELEGRFAIGSRTVTAIRYRLEGACRVGRPPRGYTIDTIMVSSITAYN